MNRSVLEAMLIQRAGKLMTAAGLDGTTVTGANADLNDPIGLAMRRSGYSLVNPAAVSDADVDLVSTDDLDQVLDIAEWRLLNNILGNLDLVDISANGRSESLGQLAGQIEKLIDQKTKYLAQVYAFGQNELQAGVIGLDFMEKSG